MRMLRSTLLAMLVLGAGTAAGQTVFYLEARGSVQGDFTGDVTAPGREGQIRGLQYHHDFRRPFDASGAPTGPHQFEPLTIVKAFDRSNPMWQWALTIGEPFDEFTLRFYRPDDAGGEELYYTIFLQEARIIEISNWAPEAGTDGEGRQAISVVFERITWEYQLDGGGSIVTQANWNTFP